MSTDMLFSSLKVGDKIDFYDQEDKVTAHWKVAVITYIQTYKAQNKDYIKMIQPLNTHTPHHDPNSISCSYELDRNFSTDCCTKCKRECCKFCFVIKMNDESHNSKTTIFCKECVQICHKNKKCDYIYADKCRTCQKKCCTKCSFIHIYNRSNGKLISHECYQCYPLKQY
eukprot:18738_1